SSGVQSFCPLEWSLGPHGCKHLLLDLPRRSILRCYAKSINELLFLLKFCLLRGEILVQGPNLISKLITLSGSLANLHAQLDLSRLKFFGTGLSLSQVAMGC